MSVAGGPAASKNRDKSPDTTSSNSHTGQPPVSLSRTLHGARKAREEEEEEAGMATRQKRPPEHRTKTSQELNFDATRLGVLDPPYLVRVAREGFISKRGWGHLSSGYRYTGVDHSLCGNLFLHLWWDFVVRHFVPLWIA